MNGLLGKIAIVTGAGRGIGKGCALALAEEGVNLVLNDLEEEPLRDTASLANDRGVRVITVAGSVSDPKVASRLTSEAIGSLGDLHVVIACAGYTWDVMFHRMTDEQWDAMLEVHLTGTMRVTREAFSAMRLKAQTEEADGVPLIARKIITISSISSFGSLGQANYAAAKAGTIGLTRTLALEGARFNILANAVAFGLIDTRLTRTRDHQAERLGNSVLGIPSDTRERLVERIPLGRMGTIPEAVGPILFLASDHANYVSGALLEVNGAAHIS